MERQFSERQLIRWAIPGWITLFLVILLISVHLLLDREFGSCIWRFLPKFDGGTFAAAGAAVIALGFALGFMLSQVYFVLYWCKWKFWEKLIGGVIDYEQVFHALDNFESTMTKDFGHWPAELTGVRTPRQQWEVSIVAAWWRAMDKKKERIVWENRNQYLVAVYHSLGAILVGTYLMGLGYSFAVILPSLVRGAWAAPHLWLPLLINLALLVAWGSVLWFGRKNTECSHRNLMKHALHYFYQQEEEERGTGSGR